MAFGKDDKNLGNVGSFRNSTRMHQQQRPKPTGGAKPYFIDRFQPSTEEPDQIRILKVPYEIELGQADGTLLKQTLFYFPYVEHFHGSMKKGSICSAGPFGVFKNKGEPCYGCEKHWGDKNAGVKNGPMGKRDMWAFTVIHFAPYAKVEQTDSQTGAIRTNDAGQPYYNWVRVHPHERLKYQGKEMRDHSVLHWSLGFGHFNTLTEYDKEIGKSCKSCGGRDTIVTEAWLCPHCGDALIEPATTTLSAKEIEEMTSKEVRCGSCQQVGMLQEMLSCKSCSNPVRAEIFDVDLNVKRVKPADGGNQTTLMIPSWSNPRPIDQRYADVKPLDLPRIFAPTPYDKQLEIFAAGGGRQPVTSSQLSRPYGGGQGGPPTLGGGGGPKY